MQSESNLLAAFNVLKFLRTTWENVARAVTVLSRLSYHQAIMNLVQFVANGHIDTHMHRCHTLWITSGSAAPWL